MLIDAYAAGLPALKQARLAGRAIEARVGECLDYAPDDANLAPLAAEAIVAGIFAAARSSLLRDEADLIDLGDALGLWASAYHELPARQIVEAKLVDQVRVSNDDAISSSGNEEGGRGAPDGDRALLLAATARLVASRGDANLELEDIVSTAGISGRGFEAEFSDPEACVAAAHRQYADGAIDRVTRAGETLAPLGDARLALSSLGVQIAADPSLATLCFSDVAIAGPRLVRSHQRFLTDIACLAAGTTGSKRLAGPAAAASAGALWGPLRQRVIMGRSAQAPEIAPAVTSLALFPLQAEASRFFTS
jgi:AcrR family transcriptional regulator